MPLFNKSGKKIKLLALIVAGFLALGAFVTAVILMIADDDLILLGLGIWIVGTGFAIATGLLINGFGELVHNTQRLADHFCGEEVKPVRYQYAPAPQYQPQYQQPQNPPQQQF